MNLYLCLDIFAFQCSVQENSHGTQVANLSFSSVHAHFVGQLLVPLVSCYTVCSYCCASLGCSKLIVVSWL